MSNVIPLNLVNAVFCNCGNNTFMVEDIPSQKLALICTECKTHLDKFRVIYGVVANA